MTADSPVKTSSSLDRALRRILAEIDDGLRHGYFEYTLTCEVIAKSQRRLTLRAGKSHQFMIPQEECTHATELTPDSRQGSDRDAA